MSETEPAGGEGVLPATGTAPGTVPGERRGGGPPAEAVQQPVAEEVFAAFYRGFVPTLVTFLVWQGASVHVAADLAQETMVKAYRNWPRIDHPQAWARRVASRELVRHLSAVEADPFAEVPEPTALLPRPDAAAALEQRHDILRLLAELPWRQRQVMAWTYDGYSPALIAEELGIEPAAVRASLKKARRALAARLADRRDER